MLDAPRPRPLGKSLYFLSAMLRPLAIMAVFRPGLLLGGPAAMSLRALLYRRPSEPSSIQVVFDRSIYLVRMRRHRQARRYTLRIDAASREVVLTMPPRGSVQGSQGIRAEARRLDRGAAQAAAGGGAVRARHRGAAARRAASHRASPRRARHGVDRDRRERRPAALRRRRAAASSTAASATSSSARRQRDLDAASRRYAARARRRRSSASRCATSRAAGARARTPACCRSPGG